MENTYDTINRKCNVRPAKTPTSLYAFHISAQRLHIGVKKRVLQHLLKLCNNLFHFDFFKISFCVIKVDAKRSKDLIEKMRRYCAYQCKMK